MYDEGLTPDSFNILDAMQAWSDSGIGDNALSLFRKFLEDGGFADGYHFAAAMHTCSRLGDVDACHGYLAEMKSRGIAPNAIHYGHLMMAHINNGQYAAARAVFEELIGAGIAPDSHIFASLIFAIASERDRKALEEAALMLTTYQLGDDPYVRSALARAWLAFGDRDKASLLLRDAANTGFTEKTVLQLIKAYASAGECEVVEEYCNRLNRDWQGLPIEARTSLIAAAARAGLSNRTAQLFDELVEPDAVIPPKELGIVLSALAAARLGARAELCGGASQRKRNWKGVNWTDHRRVFACWRVRIGRISVSEIVTLD